MPSRGSQNAACFVPGILTFYQVLPRDCARAFVLPPASPAHKKPKLPEGHDYDTAQDAIPGWQSSQGRQPTRLSGPVTADSLGARFDRLSFLTMPVRLPKVELGKHHTSSTHLAQLRSERHASLPALGREVGARGHRLPARGPRLGSAARSTRQPAAGRTKTPHNLVGCGAQILAARRFGDTCHSDLVRMCRRKMCACSSHRGIFQDITPREREKGEDQCFKQPCSLGALLRQITDSDAQTSRPQFMHESMTASLDIQKLSKCLQDLSTQKAAKAHCAHTKPAG